VASMAHHGVGGWPTKSWPKRRSAPSGRGRLSRPDRCAQLGEERLEARGREEHVRRLDSTPVPVGASRETRQTPATVQ
jgi:hypothetical protein